MIYTSKNDLNQLSKNVPINIMLTNDTMLIPKLDKKAKIIKNILWILDLDLALKSILQTITIAAKKITKDMIRAI